MELGVRGPAPAVRAESPPARRAPRTAAGALRVALGSRSVIRRTGSSSRAGDARHGRGRRGAAAALHRGRPPVARRGVRPSAGFVARRLLAEPMALVFAVREPGDPHQLAGLPELLVRRAPGRPMRAPCSTTAVPGRIDERVRDRSARRRQPARPPRTAARHDRGPTRLRLRLPVSRRAVQQLEERVPTPVSTRSPPTPAGYLQLAAAVPVGEPLLLWRAAAPLVLHRSRRRRRGGRPARDRPQIRFRHPLRASAAYRSATPPNAPTARGARRGDRRRAPTRPARVAPRPGRVRTGPTGRRPAGALGRPRRRARRCRRGRSFLERAATLTPDPAERVRRLLAAARAKRDAGALEAALRLLTAAEAGPLSAAQAAEVEHMRGQIAFDQRRIADAARLLGGAAKRWSRWTPRMPGPRTLRRSARPSGCTAARAWWWRPPKRPAPHRPRPATPAPWTSSSTPSRTAH